MKNFIKSILPLLLFSIVMIGCKKEDQPTYDGDSLLHFDRPTQTAFVKLNQNNADYNLTFGTTKVVSSDNSAELVYLPNDPENTAVLGTDFTIVKGTSILSAGQSLGNFIINVKETAANANKKAVFTLRSSTLTNAIFNQRVVVNFAMSCPLTNFPMNYMVDVYAFNEDAPSHNQTFVKVSGTDNQFNVASAWGPNFVAWATGNNGYAGQYLYSGVLTINCTTATYKGNDAWATGGTGTYNPITGVIVITVGQTLFSDPFTAQCTFNPM